jgi:hypothetical protein
MSVGICSLFESSSHVGELYAQVAKFRGLCGPIKATRQGEYGLYADLDDIWDVIRQPLSECGLAVMQPLVGFGDGGLAVVTVLAHSEQWVRTTVPLARGRGPQDVAADSTYWERQSLLKILCLAVKADEADDDGTQSQTAWIKSLSSEEKATYEQAKRALANADDEQRGKYLIALKKRVKEGKMSQETLDHLVGKQEEEAKDAK